MLSRSSYIQFFFILNISFSIELRSQEPFLYHYSTKDGLGGREVHHVFQDSKGYMWFSTDGGITKYDANTFKNFTTYNGLPDNTVFEVMEDKQQRLWFRTFTGGIGYIYNDSVFTIEGNKKIVELQGKGILQSFAMDEKGTILLGRTADDECCFVKADPPYKEINVTKLASKNISKAGMDAVIIGKKIIFSESRDFFIHNGITSVPYAVYISKDNKLLFSDTFPSIETNALTKMFLYGNEVIYASGAFLRKYDLIKKNKEVKKLSANIITLLKENEKVTLGYRFMGIKEYENFKLPAKNNYLKNRSITAIKKDSYGGYWFSTLEDGVFYCPDKNYKRIKIENSENEKTEINTFLKLNDSVLLAGTKSGNIYSLKLVGDSVIEKRVYSQTSEGAILRLVQLFPGKLFINNNSSPYNYVYEVKSTGDMRFDKKVLRCKEAYALGNYYFGLSVKNVFVLDKFNYELKVKIEFDERIKALAYDTHSAIFYAGGRKGLYEFDPENKNAIKKTGPTSRIEDLLVVNDNLFIATRSDGLIIKNGPVYDTISVKNDLLSNICKKLFFHDNELWLITNAGLSRIRYKGYKNYTIKNYALTDYVFPEGIEQIAFIKGSLVFFDKNDLCFFPLSREEIRQPFVISSVFVNGKRQEEINNMKLGSDQTNVVVNVAALFFANNGNISYRYKFTGDGSWEYINKPNINFPSLSPGNYHLKLQARNNSGKWIDCENELYFSINKPVWLRWWFIILESVLGAVILTLIVYFRYKQALDKEREKNEVIKKMYDLEIKVVKAQMNPHFISNCLAAIQELIYNNEVDKAGQYIAKFSFFMRQILNYSDKTLVTLKEELEIISLNMELEKLRFKDDFEFSVKVENNIETSEVMIPSLITQPFIENAIWHGLLPLKGIRKPKLKLTVKREKGSVNIEIEDNGAGRQDKGANVKENSKGTKLVKDKLEYMNKLANAPVYNLKIVDLEDENGKATGTKIVIQIKNYTD